MRLNSSHSHGTFCDKILYICAVASIDKSQLSNYQNLNVWYFK